MPGPFESLIAGIDPAAEVRKATAESEFLAAVTAAVADAAETCIAGRLRSLTAREIEALERTGCEAEDWSRVTVAEGFRAATVRRCRFLGDVLLGRFGAKVEAAPGFYLPSGVHNSTLSNAVVGDGALVHDVLFLGGYVVSPGALVIGCGEVVCAPRTRLGNGQALDLGNEVGGRVVPSYAEITVPVAAAVAARRGDREMIEAYEPAVAEYVRTATAGRGIIGAGARVRYTSRVRNSYIGPGALVDAACSVTSSTLLSSPEQPVQVEHGAVLHNTILQWNSAVNWGASVWSAVLCEGAHVSRAAKVQRSLIGPNSTVEKGEVIASLVGPFVTSAHQSLLIAALWPEGRGNVGYGAHVGSPPTGRLADQEIRPGEGFFFGLGATVRFPAAFSRAPFSLLAAGVTTLPQRVVFPFSLINSPGGYISGVPPAYNEIQPGWVVAENLFAVFRTISKHRDRAVARRTAIETEIFRPEIADAVHEARETLRGPAVREIYMERDLPGLGKNFLTEAWRQRGIEAYTFLLRLYALRGWHREIEAGGDPRRLLEDEAAGSARWAHERPILREEYPSAGAEELLQDLAVLAEHAAQRVQAARARDDARGARIIDDYADCHPNASADGIVRSVWAEAEAVRTTVEACLRRMREETSPSPSEEAKQETAEAQPPPEEAKQETAEAPPSPPEEAKQETAEPSPPSEEAKQETAEAQPSPEEAKKETDEAQPSPEEAKQETAEPSTPSEEAKQEAGEPAAPEPE